MFKRQLEKRIEILPEVEKGECRNPVTLEYYLIEGEYDEQEELGSIIAYGIEIDKMVREQCEENEIIRNFSCCRDSTEQLILKLADNTVTPVSLRYVIDDMLGI